MRVQLYIENTKVDLYSDESIDIKSSVQDVNDITSNTTDYTKTFKVPASSINNKLFKHYYDADIDNSFDARTKVNARLELDGLVFRYGKANLTKVNVKHGRPDNYTIVFYGNLVNLKDLAGDDLLSKIDLSYFNHEYNSTNILNGATFGLFNEGLVYPFLTDRRFYYSSDENDGTDNPEIVNIAWNSVNTTNGIDHTDLKFSIKLIHIIEAIEVYLGITFSRDFFGRNDFQNIYMWLNPNTEDETDVIENGINFNTGSDDFVDFNTNTGTFPYYTGNTSGQRFWKHKLTIQPDDVDIEYTVDMYLNGVLYSSGTYTGNSDTIYETDDLGFVSGSGSYDIYFVLSSTYNFTFSVSWLNVETFSDQSPDPDIVNYYVSSSTDNIITGDVIVSKFLPKIKIIDFLKGLFNMYKLVVIQENDTDPIYVNTLKDYYAEGLVYDLTEFIDSSEYDVERGNLLNTINYSFSEPQTLLNMQFENNNGIGYGDEEVILNDEEGNILDGDSLEIELPFEQVVYERLRDVNTNNLTGIQYGLIVDEELEPVNIEPHLHYIVFQDLGSYRVALKTPNDERYSINDIIIPSHTDFLTNPQNALLFGAELSTYTGNLITNTLFKNWHFDFIKSIFNKKRRTFKYTAYNLPYRYLIKLKLKDVIKIKDSFFRINSFSTNLVTGKVSFELINSFDEFVNTNTEAVINSRNIENELKYYIGEDASININDIGYGTTWISGEVQNNFTVFSLDENTNYRTRKAEVNIIKKNSTEKLIINQNGSVLTWGNKEVTMGDKIITFNTL